jgi:plastocyanin
MVSDGHSDPDGTLRARWTQLAALGLLLVGLAPFLMLVAALVWGLDVGDEIGFFVSLVVVPWVGAFLVWRFGTWAKIVAIVIALAGLAALFWTAFGLALPASFFDFVPGLLVIPGAIIAIVASIGGIVAKRRGHMVAGREGGEWRAIRVVLAVIGVLALVSATLTISSRSAVDASGADAEVDLKDFAFDQDAYSIAGGSTIVVRNQDPFAHTFTIDPLGVDVHLGPGSSEVITIPAQAGSYVVYCTLHTSDPQNPTPDDMTAQVSVG